MNTSTNFKVWTSLLCCLLCTCMYAQTQTPEYVPNEFIIKMKPHKSTVDKLFLKNQMQASTRKTLPTNGIEVWEIPDTDVSRNIEQIISEYRDHPDIEYIEPNYYFYLAAEAADGQDGTPSDPDFSKQWGLHNTGQNGGTPDADINAPEAWDIATGSPSVKVAVIDTGIDWKHPDLINNIWQNLGEDLDGDGRVIEWNGSTWIFDPDDINDIDDDGNGYPDDFIGWDFTEGQSIRNNPADAYGHGTHVAGIIGATGNNGIGISGVTWDVQLVPLRVFSGISGSTSAVIEAISYAIQMDIPISNNSYEHLNYFTYSTALRDVIQTAEDNGHLFIAAAGNGDVGIDTLPNYPASFNNNNIHDFDNVISVAAINRHDALWTNSNYGVSSVSIGAPGDSILSTYLSTGIGTNPASAYRYLSGTSMATPHVTGACALLMETYPDKSYSEIKDAILNTATVIPALTNKCTTNGRLNLYEAMNYLETLPPVGCRERDSLALVALYEATDGANWDADAIWDLIEPINTWYGVILNNSGCVSEVNLSFDGLDGSIPPELGDLNSLIYLSLTGNQLSGSIPTEFGNLHNLSHLRLADNQLSGSIPSGLGNLDNLMYLDLGRNSLSGNIPPELGNLNNLIYLDLDRNGLGGNIPPELGNLSSLEHLYLNYNGLNGNIPPELGNLCRLDYLYLNNNSLSSSIPPELGDLSGVKQLFIERNQLSGIIPPELSELSNLSSLNLSNNQLVGDIPPELGNFRASIFLYNNNLNGCYDANLMNLTSGSNASISSGNNFDASWEDFKYNGTGACSNLYPGCTQNDSIILVNFYNNMGGSNWVNKWDMNQPVNTWYGVTVNGFGCVTRIALHSNQLSGNLLPEIGNLSSLTNLSLPSNELMGSIPVELGNLSSLKHLDLTDNQLTGNIPLELSNLSILSYLNLHSNQLTGNIPPELGNLINLTHLGLGDNQLTGFIPKELGNLKKIESLYLGDNQLIGGLPSEFEGLCNLTSLNVQNNQLNGCYEANLMSLCSQFSSYGGISGLNDFDATWYDFCNTGAGTCTDYVWPGDYNYDGTVDETDPLHWGLASGFTGPVRPGATTAFEGQQAPDWQDAVQGINSKHQDGNGDGIVDGLDLQVVDTNFGSIHNYTQPVFIASDMQYELVEADAYLGQPSYDLYVYDSGGNNIDAHGLAGVLEFYDTPVTQVLMRTDNSSLMPSDTLTVFDSLENRLHFALTRSDRVNQTCTGAVANFIVVMQDIPTNDSLAITIENGSNIQANGDMLTVAGVNYGGLSPVNISSDVFIVNTSTIHVQCNVSGSAWVTPMGDTGPYTYQWNTGESTDRITDLSAGIYDVTVTDAAGSSVHKSLIVEGQYIPLYDAAGNPVDCLYSPCPTLLTPDGAVLPGTYQADRTINSDGILTGDTEYKAGEVIILDEGFEIPPGTEFSGTIEDCDGD